MCVPSEDGWAAGPLALTVEQAAEKLGVSRSAVYRAIREDGLPKVRLGRRYLVPLSRLEEWLGSSHPGVWSGTPSRPHIAVNSEAATETSPSARRSTA